MPGWPHVSRAAAAALIALGLACAVGCGDGDQPTQADTTRSTAPEAEKPIRPNGRVKGQNACTSASIRTGSNPQDIEFEARCSGPKAGKVNFVLQRYSLDDPGRTVEIDDYTRSPVVRGAGAVSPRADCSMKGGLVRCSATIDGPVVVSGRFTVQPESRCEAGVWLTGVTSSPCEGRFCSGSPVLDELASGRPQGCGI